MAEHRPPRASAHVYASFPAKGKIPEEARPAVLAFLVLRRRVSEAHQAHRDAVAQLPAATGEDRAALADLVLSGGSSATFDYPATTAAKRKIEHTKADFDVLQNLIGQAYIDAVNAAQRAAEDGMAIAEQDTVTATIGYQQAITAVEEARRAYLDALGLRFFWAHLTEQGQAMAGAGAGDQLILKRGPITRIDDHTFKAMRSDAQAHTRIDGTGEALTTW
ncbi:hypothetical protein F9278_23175 [Streptomyces phaeolivaceus]|uniref:Uncharacterized protein n=1 Tax=Streptomyces phaeolivaceus TaxID=2653200 RepID=A0A5P8K6Z8_9ACTN|nr:hypothetical protein [Streptomyces phaeolivaceus]QFQ98582.1 hypothetical protein F9278_23175 [Streptomyces phaeolivaceus]